MAPDTPAILVGVRSKTVTARTIAPRTGDTKAELRRHSRYAARAMRACRARHAPGLCNGALVAVGRQ